MWHIREINLRIHTLGVHIHTQCHNIHITGTLTVSKQSSFYTVSSSQKSLGRSPLSGQQAPMAVESRA